MFIAAAIASAFVVRDRLEIFEIALKFVPRRSRFYEITADCIEMVRKASSWIDGYEAIHANYGEYGHCQVYQEVGTLINSTRFAESVGHGICIQVSQGCDTDCFGEIIGSILGVYFGPGYLEPRWLAPFGDRLHTSLASFHEQRLSAVAARMAKLPELTV
jgi:ADP-ribosylglycohydrolase